MRISDGFRLKVELKDFNQVRNTMSELVYRVLKKIINNKFSSKDDFSNLMNDRYETILDDLKVRNSIIDISGKPSCILYVNDDGNYIQFFNFVNDYSDIILTCLNENYIECILDEEKNEIWKKLLNDFKDVPIDCGFVVSIITENVLSKVVEYFYRRYYEIVNKEENPEV